MPKGFTNYILGALIAGLIAGAILHQVASDNVIANFVKGFGITSAIFLRLIKMVIAPLVFAILVGGIAHVGDHGSIARIGLKAMAWFLFAGLISLTLGTTVGLVLKPGTTLHMPLPASSQTAIQSGVPLEKMLTDLVPASIFEAMSNNSMLQIVVFSVFAGCALAAMGARGGILVKGVDALGSMMLKITNYVMLFSPIGVFAAVAGAIAQQGFGILTAFSALLASFYLGLALLIALMLLAGYLFVGRRLLRLLQLLREPALLAFSTTNSEAALPKVLSAVTRFGAPKSVAGLVLPLSYSFNLDASMMYGTFATLFVVQAYGVHLAGGQIVMLMLLLFFLSKGLAAVPRAILIAVAATLPHFNIPEAGVLLLFGVDHFMNMGRSVANVLGNALAVIAVARWEGSLAEEDVELEALHESAPHLYVLGEPLGDA
jgi:Na+/H+-dicarboxylate symporter